MKNWEWVPWRQGNLNWIFEELFDVEYTQGTLICHDYDCWLGLKSNNGQHITQRSPIILFLLCVTPSL